MLFLFLQRCLRHPSHQSVLTHRSFTHSLLCHSKKSEAIATYEQLLHEHAPLIRHLDRSTTHDAPLTACVDASVEDAEGVHKYKGGRNLRMAMDHFCTLRTVSRIFESSVRQFILCSRHMKIQYNYLIFPSSSISPLLRPILSLGIYARCLHTSFRTPFSHPPRLRGSLPLLSSKQV
ncbi:hypothetical protein BJV74DRAFT_118819 [Russula compacta]|nr:hypothetical protein BJV74DRAFT_118819 [Russula compacta]